LREEVYAEKVLIKIDPEIKNSHGSCFQDKEINGEET